MTIPLGLRSPAASSRQPGPLGAKLPCPPAASGMGRAVPIRRCSRWGLPCRSCCQSRGGLLPHRFTLAPASGGGLFSVALSLGLPPPGVTRHRCFWESGLSSTPQLSAGAELWAAAVIRPSARGPSTPPPHPGSMGLWPAHAERQAPPSLPNRAARSATIAMSRASSGPAKRGRKRSRNAASNTSGGASG